MNVKKQSMDNQSSFSEFILLEFSDIRELQILHSIIFLVLYLTSVTGNLLIISAVAFDHHLHTPMYFFLVNLALQDLGQISVIIPKSMVNSLLNTRYISYSGCVAQVLLFISFVASDFFLLTVMAYDRYVAICKPLQYEMLMNRKSCIQMISSVWISSIFLGVLHTGGTFAPPFCSNRVNQYFCEIPQLLILACTDLYLVEAGMILITAVFGIGCFIFNIITYVYIFTAVLKIPSSEGRKKAFSTCLPHLIVYGLFVFTGYFAYFKPTSNTSVQQDLAFTVMYSTVPPLMNPVIYSMRNREIKNALTKLLCLHHSSMESFSSLIL